MKLVYLGKFVNTHGLKGEIRIISDFEFKDDVFKVGNSIYIDNNKYIINSYRKHKNYDMVMLEGINNITDIESYKGANVYIDIDEYNFEFVYSDLIGIDVYMDGKYKGKVIEILKSKLYPILKIENNGNYLVPYTDIFIKKIDLDNNSIIINSIKGLFDED